MKILRENRLRQSVSCLIDGLCVALVFCLILLLFEEEIGWALANWLLIISLIIFLLIMKIFFRLYDGLFFSLNKYGLYGPYNIEKRIDRWFESKRTAFSITAVTLILCLGILEITLRRTLDYLPVNLANHLGHGYQLTGSGIYRFDEERKTARMRKNYEREMYFNGFRWWHKTDKFGYRNPEDHNHADIVLLGDSIIYGHGLEEESTVRSHLENITKLRVANLGQQGAGIHCEYQILKHDGIRLLPKRVFLFFLNNDINDLVLNLNEKDRSRFLKLRIGDHSSRYFSIKSRESRLLSKLESAIEELYIVKGGNFILNTLTKNRRVSLYPEVGSVPSDPSPAARLDNKKRLKLKNLDPYLDTNWRMLPPFAGNSDLQQAMDFQLRALLQIKDLAQRNNFTFAFVFIYTGLSYDDSFLEIFEIFCDKNKINFLNLKSTFEIAQARGEDLFLPRDGHFTSKGAQVTAAALVNNASLSSALINKDE